jgi:hypothetical protein
MSNSPTADNEFTPEGRNGSGRTSKTRGMTFEVFLPESPANWLPTKLAAGVFSEAKETAFVAFQNLRELDDHPHLREQLANAVKRGSMISGPENSPSDG